MSQPRKLTPEELGAYRNPNPCRYGRPYLLLSSGRILWIGGPGVCEPPEFCSWGEWYAGEVKCAGGAS